MSVSNPNYADQRAEALMADARDLLFMERTSNGWKLYIGFDEQRPVKGGLWYDPNIQENT